jgi:hypothetical protein
VDPLTDELIAADELLKSSSEQLTEAANLMLLAGGRMRSRGIAAGFDDYDRLHSTVLHLLRELERARTRHAPFATQARQEECAVG